MLNKNRKFTIVQNEWFFMTTMSKLFIRMKNVAQVALIIKDGRFCPIVSKDKRLH